jgi:DNA-binding CsgD family transcriptional regulator
MTTSGPVASGFPATAPPRVRVAVVAADDADRRAVLDALAGVADVEVVAWADTADALLVLGTRADLCLCTALPPADLVDRLRDRGCRVVVPVGDLVTAVRAAVQERRGPAAPRRPTLAPRQREVLIAYVSSSDLLPTVARSLGMDRETLKTHLRRIRVKYAEVGRPAPTRRDLYVRAVEDGLLTPPSGRPWR